MVQGAYISAFSWVDGILRMHDWMNELQLRITQLLRLAYDRRAAACVAERVHPMASRLESLARAESSGCWLVPWPATPCLARMRCRRLAAAGRPSPA